MKFSKHIALVIFCTLSHVCFAQDCVIKIQVIDAENKEPLDFVSISYKRASSKGWQMGYTDEQGWVTTGQTIEEEVKYQIAYLGYVEQTLSISCIDRASTTYIVKMQKSAFELDEVIITDKFPAIIEKKDTVIYSVEQFTTGTEEKLKEILNKLPGIHVDRNNEVTFHGEKVKQILVENDKFFSGDPAMAVKYIPADAVERVEVLERYNDIRILRSTAINEKLTINIKLKKDKKKFVFGESKVATNTTKRHNAHNSAFYYSPIFTANNITDYNTMDQPPLSYAELFKIIGVEPDQMDPKMHAGGFATVQRYNSMLSTSTIYDQKSLFSIQQLRHTVKKYFTVEGLFMGNKKMDWVESNTVTTFPDKNIDKQNTALRNKVKTTFGNAKLSIHSNLESNTVLSYHLQYTANPSIKSDTAENRFDSTKHTLISQNIMDNTAIDHHISWVQQWHKKLQSIVNYRHTIYNNNNETQQNIEGLFLPTFYDSQTQRLDIQHEAIMKDKNHYFLTRTNYNINFKSKAQAFIRLESKNVNFESTASKKDLHSSSDFQNLTRFSNDFDYTIVEMIAGTRYLVSDQLTNIKIGVDMHTLSMSRPLNPHRYTKQIYVPNIDISRNINRLGKVGLAYNFDFRHTQWSQMTPQYTISSFNQFRLGSNALIPEKKHTISLSLLKSSVLKGTSKSLILSYNIVDDPIISGFNFSENNLIESYYNSTKSRQDITLFFMFNKLINKQKIFNNIYTTYSSFYQRVDEVETLFKQWMVVNRFTYTKDYKNTEISINAIPSIRNIPINNNTSQWIFVQDISVDIKQFMGQKWSVIVSPQWNGVTSKITNQNTYPLDAQIQYKTKNEKYKIALKGHNILGQNVQSSSNINIFSSTISTRRIFPRFFYISCTYVY